MTRPLRIEYLGAYYHVTSRGNERKAIFKDNDDREKFLELLGRAAEEFHLRHHCYVLMINYYHCLLSLLVEAPKGKLNRSLRYLKVCTANLEPTPPKARPSVSGKIQSGPGGTKNRIYRSLALRPLKSFATEEIPRIHSHNVGAAWVLT